MLIKQIDNIRLESFKRSFGDFRDVRWTAVYTDRLTSLRIEFESKLCGDHHLIAKRSQTFAYQFFVREWAIDFGCVEECHAAFHRGVKNGNHLLFIFRRPVPKAHSHAAESDRRYFQTAFTKLSLFHVVAAK